MGKINNPLVSPACRRRQGILQKLHSQQGVAVVAEYVITVLLVVGTLAAMTTFVRRSLQARLRDARKYMVANVSSACNTNCYKAIGIDQSRYTNLYQQYEPYYPQVSTDMVQDSTTIKRLLASTTGSSGNFFGEINQQVSSSTGSTQLPPMMAVNDVR